MISRLLGWPTWGVGLVLLGLGERLLSEMGLFHGLISGVGILLILGVTVARGLAWSRAGGEVRRALTPLLWAYLMTLVGLGVYAWGLRLPDSEIVPLVWPTLVLVGVAPVVWMELALRGMEGAGRVEVRRVHQSGASAVALVLALVWLGALGYGANLKNERFDLRAVRDLAPSPGTLELVRNLSEPVTFTLLFPPGNDVYEQVSPYFEELAAASSQVKVETFDKDRFPLRAKELKARRNGTVVVSRGENHPQLSLDVDPDKARSKIKKLDNDVREQLIKASQPQRVAYVLTGHGERNLSPRSEEPPGLKDAQDMMEQLNIDVKKLGLEQGLSDRVPADASVVLLVGPRGPLLPQELDALIRYVQEGGALLLLVDPETDHPLELEPLYAALGVKVDLTPLANVGKFVKFSRSAADHHFIFTTRFTPHNSLAVLSKARAQALLLFPTTGSVEVATLPPGAKVIPTARVLEGTFRDSDGDLVRSEGEKDDLVSVLVAVELAAEEGGKGGRVVVGADADLISDLIFRKSPANQQFLLDSLDWLLGEVNLAPQVAPPEDVPVLHTQADDRGWFYGMIGGIPLLVLGVGLLMSRRRGGKL